jgi:hypothetical protein
MVHGSEPVQRLAVLRAAPDPIDEDRVAGLWEVLPPAGLTEMLGHWRGGLLNTGHPHNRRRTPSPWHGKYFESVERALPDVCMTDDGRRYTRGATASLWLVQFRGEMTASLIYDRKPVIDHFKHVDENTVLGVMNRPVDRRAGRWLYFWLEREDVPGVP